VANLHKGLCGRAVALMSIMIVEHMIICAKHVVLINWDYLLHMNAFVGKSSKGSLNGKKRVKYRYDT
jgi:hypothetical protein